MNRNNLNILGRTILKITMVVVSFQAYSDTFSVGNGGKGLRKNGHIYTLDLVEAGTELAPFFNPKIFPNEEVQKRLAVPFFDNSFPVKLIAQKLAEVAEKDPVLSLSLTRAMEMYSWRLVDSTLLNTNDQESVVEFNGQDLVQLATRKQQTIRIDRNLWQQLDEGNRTALIFHEVVYGLIKKTSDGLQSSSESRDIVAYFFTPDFEARSDLHFYSFVQDKLPVFQGRPTKSGQFVGKKDGLSETITLRSGEVAIATSPGIKVNDGRVMYRITEDDYRLAAQEVCRGTNQDFKFDFRLGAAAFTYTFEDSAITWKKHDFVPMPDLDLSIKSDPSLNCPEQVFQALTLMSKKGRMIFR